MIAERLVVDGNVQRAHASREPAIVHVAVGIILREDRSFLMSTRPPGRPYAGYWEFPGGKVEAGEAVADALVRELREELDLRVLCMQPWMQQVVDYPHSLVNLHYFKVTQWAGQLRMVECQESGWFSFPVPVDPILPGTIPALHLLEIESPTRSVQ